MALSRFFGLCDWTDCNPLVYSRRLDGDFELLAIKAVLDDLPPLHLLFSWDGVGSFRAFDTHLSGRHH